MTTRRWYPTIEVGLATHGHNARIHSSFSGLGGWLCYDYWRQPVRWIRQLRCILLSVAQVTIVELTPETDGNNNPTFEYYPSRGDPILLPILVRTLPANLYPLTWLLPSGMFYLAWTTP